MKRKILSFCSIILAAFASADAADVFSVMDRAADGLEKSRMQFKFDELFPAAKASQQENACGLRIMNVDLSNDWSAQTKTFFQPDILDTNLNMLTARGEYTVETFSVFMLSDAPQLVISCSELENNAGHKIAADRLQVLEISPYRAIKRYHDCQLIYNPQLNDLKKGQQLNFILFADVPESTAGGLYRGTVSVQIPGCPAAELKVNLQVGNFTLPEYGDWGFFMTGNFYNPAVDTPATRVMQTGFVKENLSKYFDFYKSRRLDSIALYDNYPDIRYVDGKVVSDFAVYRELSEAMKKSQLNGRMIIDLRDIGYWANAVADKLDKLGGKAPQGDINITMDQRKMLTAKNARYPEKAREIYAEAVKLLLDQAAREQWVPIMVLADEEVTLADWKESYAFKDNNYESYMPVLMKICPEKTILIDEIRHMTPECIDRSVRDKVLCRAFNSWSDQALKQARLDNAEVLSYGYEKYDTNRLYNGLQQILWDSNGHFQWADLWDSYNYQWQFSRLSEAGVVSSRQMEWRHEGIVDYASCRYLQDLAAQARGQGRNDLADYADKVLSGAIKDIPREIKAGKPASMLSNKELNNRRAMVFAAIEKLLGVMTK